MDYKERLSYFRRIIISREEETVDLHRLASLALRGIPDENSLRPRTWKLLLRYLPSHKSDWESLLYEKRCQYYTFVNELLAEPDPNDEEDHPLNSATTSKWSTFFHDNEILEQIDKDVRRTNPDLAWFQLPVPYSSLSPLSPSARPLRPKASLDSLQLSSPVLTPPPTQHSNRRVYPAVNVRRSLFRRIAHLNTSFGARERTLSAQGNVLDEDDGESDLHWEAIERLLFIYAKLNPAISYVQGMNELIAPIYYVLAQDELEENSAHAEADTFHLFTTLMSSLHSIFIRPAINPQNAQQTSHIPAAQLSSLSHSGMHATLDRFSARLHSRDKELATDLDEKGLETTFYAFRWFTCLAPGGLGLPDTIRLWDSLFADWCLERETSPTAGDDGFRFLEDFGIAVLLLHRETLLEGGFSENITLLQRKPVEDLAKTLALAYALREERVTNALNEENEISEPPTPSSTISGRFKFGKEEEKSETTGGLLGFRRVESTASTQSAPTSNGSRWGRGFFKNNSNTQVNVIPPKTPPPPETADIPSPTGVPSKFSPGAWGASLSAASRKLNKLRLTPGNSPDTSPSQSKTAVHLNDRTTSVAAPDTSSPTLPALAAIKGSTSVISARIRESFERRNELMSKVGGWVANTHESDSARSSPTDWEDIGSARDRSESRANEELKRLEGEVRRKEKEDVSPEEYIARIKKRREEREENEVRSSLSSEKNIDDPLGVNALRE